MKKLLSFVLFLAITNSLSQRKYAKQFSFLNDNDVYTSTSQDRYYTNGMFLNYRFLGTTKNEKILKKAYQIQLGHRMYSPYKAVVFGITEHDRPFAANIFGEFGIDYYFSEDVLKTSVEIGMIGPSAMGEGMMKFVHDILDLEDATGWKYQIADAFAFGGELTYVKPLWTDDTNYFDISWYNNARAGTVFVNATSGLYARVGFKPLQKLVNSIAFGGNLNNDTTNFNNEVEVFFYAKPTLTLVGYDATIQGSIFNNNSPVTYDVERFYFASEFGIRFTANRFNFGYAVHVHGKKLKSIRVPNTNIYGSILLSYQFN